MALVSGFYSSQLGWRKKKKKKYSSKAAKKRHMMPYREFLKTEYWQKVRQEAIKRDKKCKICGSDKRLEVHHLSYQFRGDELKHMTTVVVLCHKCHGIEHFGKPDFVLRRCAHEKTR